MFFGRMLVLDPCPALVLGLTLLDCAMNLLVATIGVLPPIDINLLVEFLAALKSPFGLEPD